MSDKQVKPAGRSCETVASFLIKTYEILEHPQFQNIICWEKDGIGFIVKDVVLFTKEILPKYFRHRNFSSFVRQVLGHLCQLNMYDFHKVKQQNDNLVFKNPLFRKGEQSKLREIKRKASKKNSNPRRSHHERTNGDAEKYFSVLKVIKKSVEAQINQSTLSFEKSLNMSKQNNQSNKAKKELIDHVLLSESTFKKLDLLLNLKEECNRYFEKIQGWLNEGSDIVRRKQNTVNSCIAQLTRNKQEAREARKFSEAIVSCPVLPSKSIQTVVKL